MKSSLTYIDPFHELPDRFLDKIQFEPNTGCWLWDGYCNSKGYGNFRFGGKTCRSHRLSYELYKGKIPQDHEIDHICRVRSCVNPAHLEAVTHQENCRRGAKWHRNRLKTHCRNGHPYSDENTYVSPKGYRWCRICKAESSKRRTQK